MGDGTLAQKQAEALIEMWSRELSEVAKLTLSGHDMRALQDIITAAMERDPDLMLALDMASLSDPRTK